ncbi:hypothetical protein FOZ60_012827 [Perkinsus olseni]|uniref:Gfo/Idh/MocA-like oxidoreductase N-terminal domain-containing protein n=1 Tax=Perkinsus olseni TaxID=32597 RepID=A0A7J6P961_PEROL|nr:hypothetical protein FOZ60_012827 [Perkinsus olseni]
MSSTTAANSLAPLNVVMVGTGEYTTGYVAGHASRSDKTKGVVGLVMFDLRRRGKVGTIGCVGTNGTKFPAIRDLFEENISKVYNNVDVSMSTWPADDVHRDVEAYKQAIDSLPRGGAITIFTPDPTHYEIAMYAIERGIHVMITKPMVMTVEAHKRIIEAARKNGVYVQVEVHKRYDPVYADAREKIRDTENFGAFQHWDSVMTQPRDQLHTFKAWAGKSSDISYYLNSHHVDYHCWVMDGLADPIRAMAVGSTGVASSEEFGCPKGTEDTITIITEWKNRADGSIGTAVYMASWAHPNNSECHTQQRFMCLGHKGEIRADQAHRGYSVTQNNKYAAVNPLYMKYTPGVDGEFSGQNGYGYRSIETFVDACRMINAGKAKPEDFDKRLPTAASTLTSTAILEAGRRSLDNGSCWISIPDLLAGKVPGHIKFAEEGQIV